MKLSIIIVSYNVKYFLEQCLYSVQQAVSDIKAEVFVVDNCSTDGSIAYLKQKFSWVNFIINEQNDGFSRANNIALEKSTGEIVLFLNPDTIIPENILTETLAFFKMHNDAGAIGVRMLDGRGVFLPESKRSFPSPLASFCKLSGLAALFPKSSFFNRYALGNLDEYATHEVDVLCGAFMMAERSLLQKLNGFDESFFMYGEDIDLSYRILKTGKTNYYLGNLGIIHFKGESTGKNRKKYTRVFYNAMNVFVKKHYKGVNALGLKILLQTGIFLRAAISFLSLPLRVLIRSIKKTFRHGQRNICLLGDSASKSEAEKIMLKHKLQKTFKGSLLIEKKETFSSANGAELIFCTGNHFSYTESINIVSTYPKKNKYLWHGLYSGSIVCSPDKKESGTFYFFEAEAEKKSSEAENNFISNNRRHADSSRNVQVSDTTGVS